MCNVIGFLLYCWIIKRLITKRLTFTGNEKLWIEFEWKPNAQRAVHSSFSAFLWNTEFRWPLATELKCTTPRKFVVGWAAVNNFLTCALMLTKAHEAITCMINKTGDKANDTILENKWLVGGLYHLPVKWNVVILFFWAENSDIYQIIFGNQCSSSAVPEKDWTVKIHWRGGFKYTVKHFSCAAQHFWINPLQGEPTY